MGHAKVDPLCGLRVAERRYIPRFFYLHDGKKIRRRPVFARAPLFVADQRRRAAFNPREDEVLASLLDMGLIDGHRIYNEIALMRLTEDGRVISAQLRGVIG